MHKFPIGVLGASGYAGRELCALVAAHPRLELAFATANERRGERARIGARREVVFSAADEAPLGDAALVFTALPHGASAAWVVRALAAGTRVVDLSSDFRPGHRRSAVGTRHSATGARIDLGAPELSGARPSAESRLPSAESFDVSHLLTAVGDAGDDTVAPYGLTELARAEVAGARVVANPGCYATAILLALLPLLRRGLVAPGSTISIAAASGVTGAGFTPRPDLLFGEVAEDFRAYATGNVHRHLTEMRAVLASFGADADLLFTPHLLPVARGILATLTVELREPVADPASLYRADYDGEPFVEVAAEAPSLRDVVRRNVARIAALPAAGTRRPTLQIFSAIDNLVKGAAGQALQNANLVLGLDEAMGLPA